jgi:hypothetical protein
MFAVDNNLCKAQAKCITNLIELIDSDRDPAMKPTKLELGNRVFSLAPLVDPALASGNHVVLSFLQSAFAELSFAYLDALLETPDWKLFEIMQKLMGYQSKKVMEVCNFWKAYFKQVNLTKDKEIRKARILSLKELIQSLIFISLAKIQITEESFIDLNAANSDDELLKEVKDQRQDYKKVLNYIGACVDAKDYWLLLKDKFLACVKEIESNSNVRTPWIQLEAIFVTLSALLKGYFRVISLEIHGDDIITLKELFVLMLNMNKDVIQLQRAIIEVLWSIAKELDKTPNVLKSALKYLFECTMIPLIRDEAVDAVLKVMECNQSSLVDNESFNYLLQSINKHNQ